MQIGSHKEQPLLKMGVVTDVSASAPVTIRVAEIILLCMHVWFGV
jgi:hypothetical protein